jgi:hypothetical protein
MSNPIDLGRLFGRTITAARHPVSLSATAITSSCPADKMQTDIREPVKFDAVSVIGTTLGASDNRVPLTGLFPPFGESRVADAVHICVTM